ncbi:hypothetical protein DFS34DRAFT_601896 [Phlyctochytrium arcticum]|nr:hypothetical protein DFS34DRAFT_601896 [Phlyctochytrium arcticum]
MPPKKASGKKGASGKKKKEAEVEAANQLRIVALKQLKADYATQCKHFVTEAMPSLVRRIDQELKRAEEFEDIDKIILNSMILTPNDIYSITTTFQCYAALGGIYIWRAKVEGTGLEALAAFISSRPSVTALHLIDCKITPIMAKHVASVCQNSTGIKRLVLDHNPLGTKGIGTICRGLSENKLSVMEKLSLRYCDADPTTADSLGQAIVASVTLQELHLDGNFLADSGLSILGKYLRRNPPLKALHAAANQINNSTPLPIPMTTIIPPLPTIPLVATPFSIFCSTIASENTRLSILDLRSNHVGDEGAKLLMDMLRARKQLWASKQADPLMVMISERTREELFEGVWALNDAMAGAGKKGGKGKKGKKK